MEEMSEGFLIWVDFVYEALANPLFKPLYWE